MLKTIFNLKRLSIIGAIALTCSLSACQIPSNQPKNIGWQTYANPRFGYQFPYPENWQAERTPSNLDGQAFYHGDNPKIKMRTWAGYALTPINTGVSNINPNFVTESGATGRLQVNIDKENTTMRLTLVKNGVQYHWQGSSPSQEFANYYKFFYYVASQYQIPSP
jgi:hypothetical protein